MLLRWALIFSPSVLVFLLPLCLQCPFHLSSYNRIICTTQRYVNCKQCKSSMYLKGERGSKRKNWIKSWVGLLQSKSKRINRWKWRQKESSICGKSSCLCVCLFPYLLHPSAWISIMAFHIQIYSSHSTTSRDNNAEKVHKVSYGFRWWKKTNCIFTVAKTKLE